MLKPTWVISLYKRLINIVKSRCKGERKRENERATGHNVWVLLRLVVVVAAVAVVIINITSAVVTPASSS